MSEALARVLTQEGINEAQKSTSTLRRLTLRPKDDSPENNKKKMQGTVYKVPCAVCPDTYVGEKKNFDERHRQHKKRRASLTTGAAQLDVEQHRIPFDDAKQRLTPGIDFS